jgi:hypothetical protein
MKAISKSERGAVPLLEVILLVVLLGVAGFAAYNYVHDTASRALTAQKRASPVPIPTPTPPGNVLQIKELGVEMTLPADLKMDDVYYIAVSQNEARTDAAGKTFHALGYVELSTHSLTASAPGCGVVAGTTDKRGVIGFEFTRENIRNYAVASGPESVKPIGDMFVGIRDRQAPCSWNGSAPNPLEDKTYGLFVEAYQSMKTIPSATPTDQNAIVSVLKGHYASTVQIPNTGSKFALCKLQDGYAIVSYTVGSGAGGGEVWLKKGQSAWNIAWEGQNYDPSTQASKLGFPPGFGNSCSSNSPVIYTY